MGLYFGRAYYRKDICVWDLGVLFSGGLIFGRARRLIIGILRYSNIEFQEMEADQNHPDVYYSEKLNINEGNGVRL